MEQLISESSQTSYGLRQEVLSPMETLAQSVSTMAPTTTPAATIPLALNDAVGSGRLILWRTAQPSLRKRTRCSAIATLHRGTR